MKNSLDFIIEKRIGVCGNHYLIKLAMEQLEFVNQTADWWKNPLQANEATEVERVWAHLLLNKRVE